MKIWEDIKIVLRDNFVKIFLGVLFYFYYVGYASWFLVEIERYNFFLPPTKEMVMIFAIRAAGIFFIWAIYIFLAYYAIYRILRYKWGYYAAIVVGVISVIVYLFLLYTNGAAAFRFISWFSFFLLIFFACLPKEYQNDWFRKLHGVLVASCFFVLLIYFPNLFVNSLPSSVKYGCDSQKVEITTKISLGLDGEEKSDGGYKNIVYYEFGNDKTSVCIGPKNGEIIMFPQDELRLVKYIKAKGRKITPLE